MRQRSIGYIGAMALAMSPMILEAQQPPPPPERESPPVVQSTVVENKTVEGEVVEVIAQKLVVRTNDGKQMTFTVDRDLTTGADPITVGDRVRVVYTGVERLSIVSVNSLAEEIKDATDRVEDAVDRTADRIEDAVDDDELPETASPLPALVLAGLALLGSGFGLSSRRRQ